jgi:hypothetical protein
MALAKLGSARFEDFKDFFEKDTNSKTLKCDDVLQIMYNQWLLLTEEPRFEVDLRSSIWKMIYSTQFSKEFFNVDTYTSDEVITSHISHMVNDFKHSRVDWFSEYLDFKDKLLNDEA